MVNSYVSYQHASKRQSSRTVVELERVKKSFRSKQVLDSINLSICRGEFVSIMGKSGAGKSTLLNLIGLLDKADGGSISLFGKPAPRIGSAGARGMLRHKIAYLFQNAALIDQDTVESNLKVAQAFSLSAKQERPRDRKEALALVGLEGFERRRVYELSGGEQQRLAVACLLMHPSELILADEPTGSLDSQNRDAVLALLLTLNEQGKTIVVVTHDPVVAETSKRVIVLN